MKITMSDLEKFNKLYTNFELMDKIKWIVIKGALSSVAKYKLLGIKGRV